MSGHKTTIPLVIKELLVDAIEFMGDLGWPPINKGHVSSSLLFQPLFKKNGH